MNVITKNARGDVVDELVYTDGLVLVSETMKDLKKRFWNSKDVLKSKGFKVNTRKTKLMVSGSEEELFKSKIDPCGVCGKETNGQFNVAHKMWKLASSQMCKNRVTAGSAMHFVCSRCEGIMEETVNSIKKLCDEVETVNGFCYLENRLNFSGGCEAAVKARVRIGWVRFRECGELLLENRFLLRMKGKVYRCCVRSAILCGSKAWHGI